MERQTITVDIAPGNSQVERLGSSQGDIGRPMGVYIIQNGVALDCSAYSAELYILKPDGKFYTTQATVDATEKNLIKWETALQETPVAGACAAQIRIAAGDDDVGTARFVEFVEASPGDMGSASESEVALLTEYARQARESATSAGRDATTASGAASSASGSASTATTAANTATQAASTATAAADRAEAVEESIPEDYSQLSDDVTELKSALTEDESLLFDTAETTVTIDSTPSMSSGYVEKNGTVHSGTSSYQYTTNIIPVSEGDIITVSATAQQSAPTVPTNPCWMRLVTAYNGETANAEKGDSTGSLTSYTVPSGIDGVRLSFSLDSYVADSFTVHRTTTQETKTVKDELVTPVYKTLDGFNEEAIANKPVYEAVHNIASIQCGKNLLDTSGNVSGALQSNGTISTSGANAAYVTSGYIRVEKDTTYCINIYTSEGTYAANGRKIFMIYNASKEPISSTYMNTTNAEPTVTPLDGGYLRVAYASENLAMVEEGTEHSDYEAYNGGFKLNPVLLSDIAYIKYSKNLLNANKNVEGALQSNGTTSTSGSGAYYVTSDFIAVEASKSYCFSEFTSAAVYYDAGRKIYMLYNASKEPISNTYTNNTNSGAPVIMPSEDGFLRVSYASVLLGMVEVGSSHSDYAAYSATYSLNDDFGLTPTMKSEIPNVLHGKKWAHCGDSASDYTNANFSGGPFAGKYKTFPRIIAERNSMTLLQNFMYSGRTLAYPSDGTFQNALCAPSQSFYYQNIPEDTDYITIMLGGNDCQHVGSGTTPDGEDATGVITLGTLSDGDPATTGATPTYDTSTYYGAYNAVCYWLRNNRPYAHVGIVIENMTTRADYTAAQIAIAEKWGYPYINLNGDERTPTLIRSTNADVPTWIKDIILAKQAVDPPDDTHPNWQTHQIESGFFEAWLRSI